MTNALRVDWVEQTVALETDRSRHQGLGYVTGLYDLPYILNWARFNGGSDFSPYIPDCVN